MKYTDDHWRCDSKTKKEDVVRLINRLPLPRDTKDSIARQMDIRRFRRHVGLWTVGDVIMYFEGWGRTQEGANFWNDLLNKFSVVKIPSSLYKTIKDL